MGDRTAADLLAAIERLRGDTVALLHVASTGTVDFDFGAACESVAAIGAKVEHAVRSQPHGAPTVDDPAVEEA